MIVWLEKRLGFFAIPNLVRSIAIMQGVAWLLNLFNPAVPGRPGFYDYLILDPSRVLAGEVWRLVTFVFIPGTQNAFFLLIAILFLMFIGAGLEQGMGAFRVTLYVFLGMMAQIVFAFLWGWPATGIYITAMLLLAFATLYPEQVIYLFFVLPLKVKWLGFLTAAWILYDFLRFNVAGKIVILASCLNYLLLFALPFFIRLREERQNHLRRKKFSAAFDGRGHGAEAFHKCATCGATELSHPEREFRVAADGKEYCDQHLISISKPE